MPVSLKEIAPPEKMACGRSPQFQSSNLQFESLKSEQINCGCFFDTMSDFNVPGSRPNKNTMKFRKSTVARTRPTSAGFMHISLCLCWNEGACNSWSLPRYTSRISAEEASQLGRLRKMQWLWKASTRLPTFPCLIPTHLTPPEMTLHTHACAYVHTYTHISARAGSVHVHIQTAYIHACTRFPSFRTQTLEHLSRYL